MLVEMYNVPRQGNAYSQWIDHNPKTTVLAHFIISKDSL